MRLHMKNSKELADTDIEKIINRVKMPQIHDPVSLSQ